MNKIFLVLVILGVMFIVGCNYGSTTSTFPAPGFEDEVDEMVVADGSDGATENREHIVEVSSEGFNPNTLTIDKGDIVRFIVSGVGSHWPASAVHPTHKMYPGSDIGKCGGGENIFDACKGLIDGDEFSFQFNEVGSWKYHDHLSLSSTGIVVVE